MLLTILQIVATVLSFVGAVLAVKKIRWCFVLYSVAAVLWIIWHFPYSRSAGGRS